MSTIKYRENKEDPWKLLKKVKVIGGESGGGGSDGESGENKFNQLVTNTIEEVTAKDLEGATEIPQYIFYKKTNLKRVEFPDSITKIGINAFEYCSSLKDVNIPNSITGIGNYAFRYCSALESVHITDIAKWCGISFGGYYSNPINNAKKLYVNGELITDLSVPDTVTKVQNYAFYNCSSLTSVTMPDGVSGVGDYAFTYCSNLTSITIGNGMLRIGSGAFGVCKKLNSVTIGSVNNIDYSAFGNCTSLKKVRIERESAPTLQNVNAFEGVPTDCIFEVHNRDSYVNGTNWSELVNTYTFIEIEEE